MKQILLVDDDPENRESVIGFLNIKSEEINVLVASNGRQAVDIAKKKKLDLIIMDWDMPVMNGIEAIRHIKKIPGCIGIPIIMFTGIRTASEDLQEALTAGAIDFLRKPVDNVELRARINSMLLLTDYFNDKIAAEERNTELLKEKSEDELHFKEKELQAMTLAMVSKNQALLDIRSNIAKISESEEMTPTMKEHCTKI
ncbi:MAG: response regulator, partial [Bacteroidetes bacterium]|nr:response regulator [Bacteroidota bacterium]